MKADKDYMLHKSCMAFAIVSSGAVTYGKIIISLFQLYIGPECFLDYKAIQTCVTIGFVFQLFLLLGTIRLYDTQIFHLKSVRWNLIAYLILCFILFCMTIVGYLFSSAKFGCEQASCSKELALSF